MIEVILKGYMKCGKYRWMEFVRATPLDRPYILHYSKIYFHLSLDVHEWLLNQNISYDLDLKEDKEYLDNIIIFEKVEDAILFKLTWF